MKKLFCPTFLMVLFYFIFTPYQHALANNIDDFFEAGIRRKLSPCLALTGNLPSQSDLTKNRFGCMVHRAETLRMNLEGQWAAIVNSSDPEVKQRISAVVMLSPATTTDFEIGRAHV